MDNALLTFIVLICIFVPLERFFSLNLRQKILRDGWKTDIFLYFANTFILQIGMSFIILSVYLPLRKFIPLSLPQSIYHLHGVIQFICIVVLAEISYYTAHRLSHMVPFLWQFHKIHHSSKQMDWLATARFHPVDLILTWSLTVLPIILLGFSAKIFAMFQLVWLFQNYLAHSNVKWPWRPFSRFFITPENHHWHHSDDPEHYNQNFAGQLMFMDHLFRTYYNPKDNKVSSFGISKNTEKY